MGQLVLEDLGVVRGGEVAVLLTGGAVGEHHAVDDLLEAPLALRGADGAAEVLGGDDVHRVHRPGVGELDAALLEVDRAVTPVGHDDVAARPGHLVVGVHSRSGVDAIDPQTTLGRLPGTLRRLVGLGPACGTARRVCHFSLLLLGKRPEHPIASEVPLVRFSWCAAVGGAGCSCTVCDVLCPGFGHASAPKGRFTALSHVGTRYVRTSVRSVGASVRSGRDPYGSDRARTGQIAPAGAGTGVPSSRAKGRSARSSAMAASKSSRPSYARYTLAKRR